MARIDRLDSEALPAAPQADFALRLRRLWIGSFAATLAARRLFEDQAGQNRARRSAP